MSVHKLIQIGWKVVLLCAVAWLLPMAATACTVCNSPIGQEVRSGIFNDGFFGTLFAVISPFPVLLFWARRLSIRHSQVRKEIIDSVRGRAPRHIKIMNNTNRTNYKPLVIAGIFMGIGLGGFFDGILFHQLLQIHSMVSATVRKNSVANMGINMVWEGLFHTLTYTTTLIGLGLLWKAGKRSDVSWSGKTFVGAMFLGWGFFNLVEGILNHHILHIHHVLESHALSAFDYAFAASGVVLIIGGWMAIRSARTQDAQPLGDFSN